MLQHPLPPQLLQTQLNQLPLASSQVGSQISKKSVEMKRFLLENIHTGLDLYNANQHLMKQLEETNKKCDLLNNWQTQWQTAVNKALVIQPQSQQSVYQNKDSRSLEEKFKVALRLSNLEEVWKSLEALPKDFQNKLSLIVSSQLPTPNKQNSEKIIVLLSKVLLSDSISKETKEQIIQTCFKTIIQKSIKMKLENKAYYTNRNLKHYYSDILQLYQSSFSKTMKIIIRSLPQEKCFAPVVSNLINNTFNKVKTNFLETLITNSEEKTFNFILTSKENKAENKKSLFLLSNSYCIKTLYPLLVHESAGRITSKILMDSLPEIQNYFINPQSDEIKINLNEDPMFIGNQDVVKYLFENQEALKNEDSKGIVYNICLQQLQV